MNTAEQGDYHEKAYKDLLAWTDLSGFTNPESIWYWMHTHCMSPLDHFFKAIPKSTFLTLGDGYCGREGIYITQFGHDVTASDLETCLIDISVSKGLVNASAKIDMNKMECGEYDFIFVKESLHHTSAPYVAISQMMEHARKGVILIEPNGDNRQPFGFHGVEGSGNYLFTFRSEELAQVGLAAGYRHFAYYYTMVFYGHENVEAIKAGKIEQEKARLANIESSITPVHRPLICFMFFNEKATLDCVGDGVNKVSF